MLMQRLARPFDAAVCLDAVYVFDKEKPEKEERDCGSEWAGERGKERIWKRSERGETKEKRGEKI